MHADGILKVSALLNLESVPEVSYIHPFLGRCLEFYVKELSMLELIEYITASKQDALLAYVCFIFCLQIVSISTCASFTSLIRLEHDLHYLPVRYGTVINSSNPHHHHNALRRKVFAI